MRMAICAHIALMTTSYVPLHTDRQIIGSKDYFEEFQKKTLKKVQDNKTFLLVNFREILDGSLRNSRKPTLPTLSGNSGEMFGDESCEKCWWQIFVTMSGNLQKVSVN